MRVQILPLLALCSVFAIATAAPAETVLFTFSGAATGSFSFDSTQFQLSAGSYDYTTSSVVTNNLAGTLSAFSFSQTPGVGTPDFILQDFDNGEELDFYGAALAGTGSSPVFTPGVVDFSDTIQFVGGSLIGSIPGVIVTISDVAPVPEPSSFLLLGTGLAGVGGAIRRRFRQR